MCNELALLQGCATADAFLVNLYRVLSWQLDDYMFKQNTDATIAPAGTMTSMACGP